MDADELYQWQLYDGIEPLEDRRADMRAAMVAHIVASSAPFKKRSQTFHIRDFMLRFPDGRPNEKLLKERLRGLAGG